MKHVEVFLCKIRRSEFSYLTTIIVFGVGIFLLPVVSISPISALARESPISALAREPPKPDVTEINKEIEAFARVRLSLRGVIAIVERRGSDAKVVDISFDGQSDQLAYRIKVYQHNEIFDRSIDALTGTTIGDEFATPVFGLDPNDRSELTDFKKSKIDLNEAAAIAEERGSGKAISAGLEQIDGSLVFQVVVVADGLLKLITVDPDKGEIKIR
jgi:uncharacterized membrane protein YkoI